MKLRVLLSFSMALMVILSGCAASPGSLPEATPLPEGGMAQATPPSDADEFQTFIEKWALSGLIPEGLTLTAEQQDSFVQYFQNFDEVERNYILLLLQRVSAGEATPTDPYNDRQYGVYLNFCQYCLYDMNGDGAPEFILKTGAAEADYWYTVYTMVDGELVDCGGLSGSHATLYTDGSGGFVRYAGHMGVYAIDISTLEGTTLVTTEIASGELTRDKGEQYPELVEYGYGDYDEPLQFNGIPGLLLAPAG